MDLFVINRHRPDHENYPEQSNAEQLRDKLFKKIEERKRKNLQQEASPEEVKKGKYDEEKGAESEEPVESHTPEKPVTRKRKKKKKKQTTDDIVQDTDEKSPATFLVLGEIDSNKKGKTKRVLPHWLDNPSVVSVDLKHLTNTVRSITNLDIALVEKLEKNNITHFFPVQAQVIPWLLKTIKWPSMYWPSDVCVSAPTGSGKTLAFVLPIVQALQTCLSHKIRALVVLPVLDLAKQVFKVFQTYTAHTKLKVILLSSEKPFAIEQKHLAREDKITGHRCLVDIVVTTPGRLVDHLKATPSFSLQNLKYLVIDEADRVMEGVQNDWLYHVNTHLGLHSGSSNSFQVPPLCLRTLQTEKRPPQKLLFSATLSQDPEKLQQLGLFQPKLFTSVVKSARDNQDDDKNDSYLNDSGILQDRSHGDFIGKFTTPAELSEAFTVCSPVSKPIVLFHLLKTREWKSVLIFTASCEGTHRLARLLKALGQGKVKVAEISAKVSPQYRNKRMARFAAGTLDILVSSDALARGIDLPNVKVVISYDAPTFIKNHVHRVGRTGRAGQSGTAVTLLLQKQVNHFKEMMATAGKTGIEEILVDEEELEQYSEVYKSALGAVKKNLEIQQAHKSKAKSKAKSGVRRPKKNLKNGKEKVRLE